MLKCQTKMVSMVNIIPPKHQYVCIFIVCQSTAVSENSLTELVAWLSTLSLVSLRVNVI